MVSSDEKDPDLEPDPELGVVVESGGGVGNDNKRDERLASIRSMLIDESGKPNKGLLVRELRSYETDLDALKEGDDDVDDDVLELKAVASALLTRKMAKKIRPCVQLIDSAENGGGVTLRKLAKVLKHLNLELNEQDELVARANEAVVRRTASHKALLQKKFDAMKGSSYIAKDTDAFIDECAHELPVDDAFLARVKAYAQTQESTRSDDAVAVEMSSATLSTSNIASSSSSPSTATATAGFTPTKASSRRQRKHKDKDHPRHRRNSFSSDSEDDSKHGKKSSSSSSSGSGCMQSAADELSGKNDTTSFKVLLLIVVLMYGALSAYTQKLAVQIAPINWGDWKFGDKSSLASADATLGNALRGAAGDEEGD